MKVDRKARSACPKLVSVVIFVVKNAGRLLLLGPDKNGQWGFPSEKFDGRLNGNLESTLMRLSAKFLKPMQRKAKCVKSFVSRNGNTIEVVYNFTADASEGDVPKPHMWVLPKELRGLELDVRTTAFAEACGLVK